MHTLSDTILFIVSRRPGVTDVDLSLAIYGRPVQQLVNGDCRYLDGLGKLERRVGECGLIGNHPASS